MEINYDQLWNMTMESANVQNAMDKVFYARVHPLTMSKIVHYVVEFARGTNPFHLTS